MFKQVLDLKATDVLDRTRQKNAIGVSNSSSPILIKFAGNSSTIKLKISVVLFL